MNNLAVIANSLIKFTNRCGKFLAAGKFRPVDFNAGCLMEVAAHRTALDDFGASNFIEPLSRLLSAYNNEADLSFIGHIAMREDILQSLMTRLQCQADRKRAPEMGDTRIESPIFITGLPRSGTTFLHSLLAEDPDLRAPRGWEVMYPSPPPDPRRNGPDRRIARAQRRMRQLYWLAPGFRVIHPLDAAEPQECIAITSSSFISDAYPTMCHIPSYQHWLDQTDLQPAYTHHRYFLQQLQAGQESLRWLLKAPAHLFGLQALLKTYPDARIVFTHRDPLEVLPSLANLTLVLRSAFSERHDPQQIGREVLEHWSAGMRAARAFVAQLPDREARCIDVAYNDLVSRPLDTVERLYRHFDLELTRTTRGRMLKALQQRPKDRYGVHRYSLEQFTLNTGAVERAFCDMHDYCGPAASTSRVRYAT